MPAPLESVVKQLTDSGIVSAGKLENFVPPKANPQSVDELVAELVKHKELTQFQAAQVKAGKTRALILGEYTILDRIGAGGMGQVFKAQHRRMKRVVAIKMLPAAMLKDAAAVARFEREVEAAAKLEHPNIVTAYDAGQAGSSHFLVMQYVDGKDLSANVKKDGPLPVAKTVNYILQAARGLEYAHSKGVIHRDIKPANLLLGSDGVVKILDMGLARIDQPGGPGQTELTSSGSIMGTVDFMSPEQALNTKHADYRADIYSLGMSLYYLLAARMAYGGETAMEKLMAHQTQPVPNLQDVQTTVPRQLDAVFKRMVAKKIEDRYQSMSEVIEDLEGLGLGTTTKKGEVASTLALSPEQKQKLTAEAKKKRTAPGTAAAEQTRNLLVKVLGGAFGTIVAPILVFYLIRYLEKREEPKPPIESTEASAATSTLPAPRVREPSAMSSTELGPGTSGPASQGGSTPSPQPSRPTANEASAVAAALPIPDGPPGKVWSVGFERVSNAYFLNNGNLLARNYRFWGLVDPGAGTRKASVSFTAPDPQMGIHEHAALSPDQRWFVFIMRNGDHTKYQLHLVDAVSGKPLRTLLDEQGRDTFSNRIGWPAVSPDSRRIVVSLRNAAPKSLAVFDVDSGKLSKRLAYSDTGDGEYAPNLSRFAPDGQLVTIMDGVRVIDLDQETRQFVPLPQGFLRSLVVSADGRRALMAGGKRAGEIEAAYLAVLDLAGIKLRAATPDPRDMVFQRADISADGRWGITANKDNLLQLWNLDTLTPLAEIGRESEPVSVVRFSPDGRYAVCGTDKPGSEGSLSLYRLPRAVWPAEKSAVSPAPPAAAPPMAKAPFNTAQAKAHQAAWAKHLGTEVETTNSVGMKMVLIPPGEFLMGSSDQQVEAALKAAEEIKADQATKDRIQRAERPQHRVMITKPLRMSATEVTVAQFRQFVEATKYVTEAEQYGFGNSGDKDITKAKDDQKGLNWRQPGPAVTDESPVTQVTWNDACAMCNWLSDQEQLAPRYRADGSGSWFVVPKSTGYQPPTEAQWEYACRAGTTSQYSFADDWHELGDYGWFSQNAGGRPWPVGLKPANAFGLHDMHGNAQEWCEDYWDERWYERSSPQDPTGPAAGGGRVIRGGNWVSLASNCRGASRNSSTPASRYNLTGFRVVRGW